MANFASRTGLILATAGSAVGLGNIWRFPTTTGENGGAAFILVYIICTLLLGLPGMMSEFIIGRNGGGNAMRSYIKGGNKRAWGAVGIMGMLCAIIILGFYSVVAGWCIYYLYQALTDNVLGDAQTIATNFDALVSNTWIPSLMSILFVLLTHSIIIRGVQGGIEKASKWMMPLLFVLLIIIIVASCSLPGAWKGIEFLFKPDFSKITSKVLFEALGQSFFSISLGTACLCTYAAYFDKKTNLLRSSVQIACIDCGIAIMAGMMIFPAAFSVGVQPDAGPNLIFLTLPGVFTQAFPHPVAYAVAILFFALLTLAALTSTISMHEIGTSLLSEELRISRTKAATVITLCCCIISILSALSMGPIPMGVMGKSLFANFDALTSNILLPFGALLSTTLVGWVMPHRKVICQLTSYGNYRWRKWAVNIFFLLLRFVCPMGIALIFLNQIGLITF